MITIISIILADVILFALFAYQYRQELGLTVNGAHDSPVVRKKAADNKTARGGAMGDLTKRGQVAAGDGTAPKRIASPRPTNG
jgi:hypothetical protein